MHEYRRFVQREMDARNWNQNDVARHAGLNRQTIHAILTDTRELLTQVPSNKTIDGLAAAFTVSRETVLAHVALAMGLPVKLERADVSEVSNDELIREMARRLKAGDGRGEATPLTQAAGSAADQAGPTADDLEEFRRRQQEEDSRPLSEILGRAADHADSGETMNERRRREEDEHGQ